MALTEAKLDWLLVTHPVSIRWLIGQDTKSYTVFQCLAVSTASDKRIMFTRGTEQAEFEADTMADEFHFYGGGEPEDPMAAFAKFADALGLRKARVGLEVPGASAVDRLSVYAEGLSLVLQEPDVVVILVRVECDLLLLASSGVHEGVRVNVAALGVDVANRYAATKDDIGGHILHSLGVGGCLEF